jgi:hypothetical protein
MSMRFIKIPEPIHICDPITGEKSAEQFSFQTFLYKLMDNPKWAQSYKMIKSADAIMEAYKTAANLSPVMAVSEDDWKHLRDAVETPKAMIVVGDQGQVVEGFGMHPRLVTQIIPFCDAVMGATDRDPRN